MKLYRNMKVGAKLLTGFIIVALIAGTVGVAGYWGLREVGNVRLPSVQYLLEMEADLASIEANENALMNAQLAYEYKQEIYRNLDAIKEDYEYHLSEFMKLPMTDAEERLWSQVQPAVNRFLDGHEEFLRLSREVDSIGVEDPAMVQYQIALAQRDHYDWIWQVSESIRNDRAFTGELDGDQCGLGQWLREFETRSGQLQALITDIHGPHQQVHSTGAQINSLITGTAENRLQQASNIYESDTMAYMGETLDILRQMDSVAASSVTVQQAMMDQALQVNTPAFDEAMGLLDEMVELNAQIAASSVARSNTMIVAFTIVAIILSILLGLFISNSIKRPVGELLEAARRIADGNLDVSIDIDSKDEIGELGLAFSHMADNVNSVMTDINTASEQVSAGSSQVADSSQQLSQGATEQASSVEQITASMEELSAQTTQNASNATQANDISKKAMTDAEQGNAQMKEMLGSMQEINESSNKISKIIKVIDEIAFQTNILALNAAVEAARAGQHGKGFAVVAEEVRNLAARSADAARETTEMIETSIDKVGSGTEIANKTAEALEDIVKGVADATRLVGEIADASNEQASGIEEVNQAILQVSQVVQTNSATSEEAAAASEELSSQAQLLKDAVNQFQLKKSGQKRSSGFDNMSPEMLKMLDSGEDDEEEEEPKAKKGSKKKRISLDDQEFGKY